VPPLRSPSPTPSLSKLEDQLKIGCAYLRAELLSVGLDISAISGGRQAGCLLAI